MYFKDKSELEDINKKVSEGLLDTAGFSRDHQSKIASGVASSSKSGKEESKKSSSENKKKAEHLGEFDSTHIENYAERMEVLKEKIDS